MTAQFLRFDPNRVKCPWIKKEGYSSALSGEGRRTRFTPSRLPICGSSPTTRRSDQLQGLVKGKAVLMLSDPSPAQYPSPFGADLSAGVIQAHLLDTLLAKRWTYELPHVLQLIAGMTVCFLAAWFLLAIKGGKGLSPDGRSPRRLCRSRVGRPPRRWLGAAPYDTPDGLCPGDSQRNTSGAEALRSKNHTP